MDGIGAIVAAGSWLVRLAFDPRSVIVATSFLGLVFLLSGIPKLQQPGLAATALVDFGLVRKVRVMFGVLLGTIECLLGVALLTRGAAPLPTALATVLLWTFTVLLARAVRSGRGISCFCFGGSDPISTTTVMRTLGLAVMSSITMLLPSPQVFVADTVLGGVLAACVLGSLALIGASFSTFREPRALYGALPQ